MGSHRKPFGQRYSHPANGPSLVPHHFLSPQFPSAGSPLGGRNSTFTAQDFGEFVGSITSRIRSALLGDPPPPREPSPGPSVRQDVFGQVASVGRSPLSLSRHSDDRVPRRHSSMPRSTRSASPGLNRPPSAEQSSGTPDEQPDSLDKMSLDESAGQSEAIDRRRPLPEAGRDLTPQDELESELDDVNVEREEIIARQDSSEPHERSMRLHQSPRPPSRFRGSSLSSQHSTYSEPQTGLSSQPPVASDPSAPTVISLDYSSGEEASSEADSSVVALEGPVGSMPNYHQGTRSETADSGDVDERSQDIDSQAGIDPAAKIGSEEDIDSDDDNEMEEVFQPSSLSASQSSPALPQSSDPSLPHKHTWREEEPLAILAKARPRALNDEISPPSSNLLSSAPHLVSSVDDHDKQILTGPPLTRGASNDCAHYISQGIVSQRVNFFEQPPTFEQPSLSHDLVALEDGEPSQAKLDSFRERQVSQESSTSNGNQPSPNCLRFTSSLERGSFAEDGTMMFKPASDTSEEFLVKDEDELELEEVCEDDVSQAELDFADEELQTCPKSEDLPSSLMIQKPNNTTDSATDNDLISSKTDRPLPGHSAQAPIQRTSIETPIAINESDQDDDVEKAPDDQEETENVDDDNDLFEGDQDLYLHRLGQENRPDFDIVNRSIHQMDNQATTSAVLGVDPDEMIGNQEASVLTFNIPSFTATRYREETTIESLMARDSNFRNLVNQVEAHGNEMEAQQGGVYNEGPSDVGQDAVDNLLSEIFPIAVSKNSIASSAQGNINAMVAQSSSPNLFPPKFEPIDKTVEAFDREADSRDIPFTAPVQHPASHIWGDFASSSSVPAQPWGECFNQPLAFELSTTKPTQSMWISSMVSSSDCASGVSVQHQAGAIVPPLLDSHPADNDKRAEDDEVDMLALTSSDADPNQQSPRDSEEDIVFCGDSHPSDAVCAVVRGREDPTVALDQVAPSTPKLAPRHAEVVEAVSGGGSDHQQLVPNAITSTGPQQPVTTKARPMSNGSLGTVPAVTFADSPPLEMTPTYHTDYTDEYENDGAEDDAAGQGHMQTTAKADEPQTPLASTTQGQRTPSEVSERFTSRGPASFVTSSAPSSIVSNDATSSPESLAPPPPLNSASMGAPTAALGLANQITRRSSVDSSTHAEPPSPSTSARQRSAPITKEQVNVPGLPHIQETIELSQEPHTSDSNLPNPLDPPPPMNAFLLPSLPPVTNLHMSEASSVFAQPPSPCFSTVARVDELLGVGPANLTTIGSLHPPQSNNHLGIVTQDEDRCSLSDPSRIPAHTSDEAIRLDDLQTLLLNTNRSPESSVAVQAAGSPGSSKSSLMPDREFNVAGSSHEYSTVSGYLEQDGAREKLPDPSMPPPATSIPAIQLEDIQTAHFAPGPIPLEPPMSESSAAAQPPISLHIGPGTKAFFSPSLTSRSVLSSDFLHPSNLSVSSGSSADTVSGVGKTSFVDMLPTVPDASDSSLNTGQGAEILPRVEQISAENLEEGQDSVVSLVAAGPKLTAVPLLLATSGDDGSCVDSPKKLVKLAERTGEGGVAKNHSSIELLPQSSDEAIPLPRDKNNIPRRGRPRVSKSASIKDTPSKGIIQDSVPSSKRAPELQKEADLKSRLQNRKRARLSSSQAQSPAPASPASLNRLVEDSDALKTGSSAPLHLPRINVYTTRSSSAAHIVASEINNESPKPVSGTEAGDLHPDPVGSRTRQRSRRMSLVASDPSTQFLPDSPKVEARDALSPTHESTSSPQQALGTGHRKTTSKSRDINGSDVVERESPMSPSPVNKSRSVKSRRSTRISGPPPVPFVLISHPKSKRSSGRTLSQIPPVLSGETSFSQKPSRQDISGNTSIASQLSADIKLQVPGLQQKVSEVGDVAPRRRLHQHNSSNQLTPGGNGLLEASAMDLMESKPTGAKPPGSRGNRGRKSDLDGRGLPASLPPVTRSHCHYVRLKFTRLGQSSKPPNFDTFLVPQCATGDDDVKQKMAEAGVEEVGEGSVEEESQSFKVGTDGRRLIEGGKLVSEGGEREEDDEMLVEEDTMRMLVMIVGAPLIAEGQVEVLVPPKRNVSGGDPEEDEVQRGRQRRARETKSSSPATSGTSHETSERPTRERRHTKRKTSQLGYASSPPRGSLYSSKKTRTSFGTHA